MGAHRASPSVVYGAVQLYAFPLVLLDLACCSFFLTHHVGPICLDTPVAARVRTPFVFSYAASADEHVNPSFLDHQMRSHLLRRLHSPLPRRICCRVASLSDMLRVCVTKPPQVSRHSDGSPGDRGRHSLFCAPATLSGMMHRILCYDDAHEMQTNSRQVC